MKKIQILDFQFKALAICGVWRPIEWTTKLQIILYTLFSLACMSITFTLPILQCLLLLLTDVDFQILTETLFSMLTAITVCVKTINFLFRREEIIDLMSMLTRSWCVPKDDEEKEIQTKSNDFIKLYTIILNIMAQATVSSMLILPLLRQDASNVLPIQLWLPRVLRPTQSTGVWLLYVYEALAMSIGVMVDATVDTTISGFMWQSCTQLELARHRLDQLPKRLKQAMAEGKTPKEMLARIEKESIVQAVLHHNYVIEYTAKVNEVIDFVVVEQFFVTSLVISIIVFQLSVNRHLGLHMYVINILYLGCILLEFFGFCWFGNEITLKCADFGLDIYKIDWCSLSSRANKTLMQIVIRTRKPVVMSVGHFFVLNVESFKNILKLSFSAFNILNESQ